MSVDLTKLMNLEDGKKIYGALRGYDKQNATIISDVDSPVATTGHAIGEIFSCDGKLYIATQTIVSGDSIVEGTNVATTFSIDNVSYPLNVVKFMQKNLEKLANIDALIDEKARVLALSPIDRRLFPNYKKNHAITTTSTVLRDVDVFYNELHTTGRNLSGSAYRAVILSRDDGLKNIGNAAEYNAVKSDFKPFNVSDTSNPAVVHPVIYLSYYFERNGKNNPPQIYLYTYDSEDKLYYARFGLFDDDGFYESYLQLPDGFVTNGNIAIAAQFRRPNQSMDIKLSIIGMHEKDMWEGMSSLTLTNTGLTVIDDITPTT